MTKTSSAFARHLPLLATGAIFVALFGAAAHFYDGFLSARVFVNLFSEYGFLGIAAVGMTLVIFSGGIDLSVGAVIGFTTIFVATLIERQHVPPLVAWLLALATGSAFGAGMGWLIYFFRLPPFLITLAGMFLARSSGFWISTDQLNISHEFYGRISGYEWVLGRVAIPATALFLVATMAMGWVTAHHTRFGRTLLAIGGNEQSALLMGLPIGRAKIAVYALNGFCAALAGIVATVYISSGDASRGIGLELDAIAIVVMGGTLLTGGRGHMFGTLLGLLIFGTIQTAITFDGRLDSAWSRIIVGGLLLVFILLQRLLLRKKQR
ncbi:MAG TPA: galactofuranose ABC transporter, permease protein YjfF [Lacunisphaera sp.]|nr:galactofuranose ABC transporter, permease protein YjfF [Lacunisphaera sp.]